MIVKNARLLKVSTPDGHRIMINTVRRSGDKIVIVVEYNKDVAKDNPPFSKNGIIKMTCVRKDYQQTLQKLTNYLETLFLKGLLNENTNTSSRISNDSRGNEKQTKPYTIGVDEGKGSDTSVHVSTRGTKSTKSSGRGKSSVEVDESSDKDSRSEDQDRD